MNQSCPESRPRILIVDDNPAIHEDFRKILGAKSEAQSQLEAVEASPVRRRQPSAADRAGFRIESAYQGKEALELVQKALEQGDPYVMAFVDVRMPPGWDGIETLERIWQMFSRTPGRDLHRLLRLFLGRHDAAARAYRQSADSQEAV